MNVYLLVEDGESFCIKAPTMSNAMIVSEERYLDEMREEKGKEYDMISEHAYYHRNILQTYYHRNILQSCSLIGELKN